ncbi:hypothetical protein FRB91_009291 [Serendipita sp. 411]|nr:hypothetical protein FRB91_009291 [Serendipita sp. 411]
MANSSSFSSSVFADFGGNATFTNQTTGFGPSSNVTSSSNNTTTVQWDPTQFDWAAIYNMQVQSKRVCFALISRVYALWNRSRRVLFIITTLVLVNLVCFIVLASIAYSRSFTFVNLAPFTGCLYMTTFTSGWVSLTIALTSETIIVILTFIRTYPIARQKTVNTPPLFNLLLQDGIFFYLLIMIAQVITLVSLLSPSVFSGPVLESSPGTVVLAIACNRMLVRLQKALIYTTQKPFTDASETESVSAEWTEEEEDGEEVVRRVIIIIIDRMRMKERYWKEEKERRRRWSPFRN